MQENADYERECEKGLCPGIVAKGRGGKHYRSSHSASSLLLSPRGGWVHAPLVAGCGRLMCHIHHFYWGDTCPTATKSVPSFPLLLLPSSILCFCEKERSASVELGHSFSDRQRSAKHFQLLQYETDFTWEPTETASKTGLVLEETYQRSLLSHQKKKNVSENSSVGKNDLVDFISFDK